MYMLGNGNDAAYQYSLGGGGGSAWKAVTAWDTASGGSLFQVDDDAGACTAAKTGRIRYDGADDEWCYCDGGSWKLFPGGAGCP
jgi:hypothetical protein